MGAIRGNNGDTIPVEITGGEWTEKFFGEAGNKLGFEVRVKDADGNVGTCFLPWDDEYPRGGLHKGDGMTNAEITQADLEKIGADFAEPDKIGAQIAGNGDCSVYLNVKEKDGKERTYLNLNIGGGRVIRDVDELRKRLGLPKGKATPERAADGPMW